MCAEAHERLVAHRYFWRHFCHRGGGAGGRSGKRKYVSSLVFVQDVHLKSLLCWPPRSPPSLSLLPPASPHPPTHLPSNPNQQANPRQPNPIQNFTPTQDTQGNLTQTQSIHSQLKPIKTNPSMEGAPQAKTFVLCSVVSAAPHSKIDAPWWKSLSAAREERGVLSSDSQTPSVHSTPVCVFWVLGFFLWIVFLMMISPGTKSSNN